MKTREKIRNRILCFGDSITYGRTDRELGGWVNRMRLALDNCRRPVSNYVFNLGISGQTSGEVLERFDRECIGRFEADGNNIAILAVGINDARVENNRIWTSEAEFRSNVTELIRRATAAAHYVLYVGLTPVDETRTTPLSYDKSKSWFNEDIQRYDAIIREIAAAEGVDYLNAWELIDPKENFDGLHPGVNGHIAIAEAVGEAIGKALK